MGIENLDHIFNPKQIAVIGASEREASIGAKILKNLTSCGFAGQVFPVNPFRQTVQGLTAYPRISKVPAKVDLAIIATPAKTVPSIIEECGDSGVSGAIIISAGFKEAGPQGSNFERQILDHKKKYALRIIGPHSFGIIRPKINLFATFADKHANLGRIAFISQSAALCASALDWAWDSQVGFSAIVSTGSMLDVDVGDLLDYFGLDPQTKSIMLYVESLKNPRKFISAAREFARDKPIMVVKAGRFRESSEAALCHSGALAGEDVIYDAAFKRAGIVRVKGMNDLFNCGEALTMQPNPRGNSLTIITNAGGPAILATDRLIARGGKLAQLAPETVRALKAILPPYCSMTNPVDVYEEAASDRFRNVLDICLKDSNSEGFLVLYTAQGATDPLELAQMIIELAKLTKKPILTCLMSQDDRCREARKILQRAGTPSFTMPEDAVSTFMYMYHYTQNLELLYQTPQRVSVERTNLVPLKGILRHAFYEGRSVLSLPESLRFLEAYQIPIVRTIVARTVDEASSLSSELSYPIVMKALSPQVTHKSKIEGVILNIWSPSDLRVFFEELEKKVRNSGTAEFQGVAIQPMVREKGWELLIGSKNDVQFGSVILFGTGGTSAESFNEVSIGFPPLNQVLARRLIEETAVFKRASSSPNPFNVKLIEEILVKFSQLVSDFPEIKAIDINPLIACEKSAVAVDARIAIEWGRFMREVAEHREQSLIASYPKQYVAARRLKNGAGVLLRPIKAEDEGRFDGLLKSLSAESVRFRFFEVFKEMPHERLARYCNLDYDRQIAIVAELQQSNGQIIGAGRVIAEPNGKSGEFAVLVCDSWQSLGLGSMLMDHLVSVAKDMRLERIFAHVLSNNYKMIRLSMKKGFKMETLDAETVKASLNLV